MIQHFSEGMVRTSVRAVRRVLLWFVLGPLAVAAGPLLWIASAPNANVVWRKHYLKQIECQEGHVRSRNRCNKEEERVLAGQDSCWTRAKYLVRVHFLISMWCFVGAPACPVGLWLRLPSVFVFVVRKRGGAKQSFTVPNPSQEAPSFIRMLAISE